MSENQDFNLKPGAKGKITAVYQYENEAGQVVFEKERHEPKSFRFRRLVNGKYVYNLKGIKPVPYRLPKWKDAPTVIIAEGEKDADILADLGFVSTSGPFGAGSWPEALTPRFKDKQVFICYDIGEEKAAKYVAASLYRMAREIWICCLPLTEYEADVTDYINQVPPSDHQRAQQIKLVQDLLKNAELYQPPVVITDNPTILFEVEGGAIEERAAIMEVDGGLSRAEAEEEARKDTCSREATQNRSLDIKNDFLNMWTDSISLVTDAPKVFILFSGIGLLSGILNKMWFSYPRRTNLNLYLLLLAPSTFYRKSVCVDIAGDYLAEVKPELIMPESFSPEALIEILSKKRRGLILWRELIQVKEFNFGSDYSKALPSLLTDIYDFKARLTRWTKEEKETTAENPTISILSAGIQSWLISGIRQEDFMGGIWTRFLFIPAPDQETKPYRRPSRFSPLPPIIDRLKELDSIEGRELDLNKIFPLLDTWGVAHQAQAIKIENDLMQANFSRLEVVLLKIAGLLQLADHPESTAIEPLAFIEAVKIIDFLKGELSIFFEEHVVFGNEGKNRAAVIRLLKKHGQLLHSDLQRLAHIRKSEELNSIMTQLKDLAKEDPAPHTSQGGKPGKLYSWIGRK